MCYYFPGHNFLSAFSTPPSGEDSDQEEMTSIHFQQGTGSENVATLCYSTTRALKTFEQLQTHSQFKVSL